VNFIKCIAEGKVDEFAHRCFVRYGIGEYEKEPLKIIRSGSGVKLSGGFEYVNAFHRFLARLNNGEVTIKGVIITSKEITSLLKTLGIEPIDISQQRMKGTFKYELSQEVKAGVYKELVEKLYDCFLLLNVRTEDARVLKVKSTSTPKIGKPTPGFVSLLLLPEDFEIVVAEFLFDVPLDEAMNARRVEILHTYIINEIEIPKEYENDPKMARLRGIRKGEIKRSVSLDGKLYQSTIPMEV